MMLTRANDHYYVQLKPLLIIQEGHFPSLFAYFLTFLWAIRAVDRNVNSGDDHCPRSYADKKAIWKAEAKSNKNNVFLICVEWTFE